MSSSTTPPLPPIMLGRNLTAPADPLERISLERVFQGLRSPKPDFRDLIARLRTVASVDLVQYRQLKKALPYIVCGLFHPAIRRKEHFATIHYFILDFDHLAEGELSVGELRAKLSRLPQPLLGFSSPGGDGYKVLFRLAEPCSDAARFHAFYQAFARSFAQEHGLERVVDLQTCDVTRACFMSYDAEAFYHPEAGPVDLNDYLPDLLTPRPKADKSETPEPKKPGSVRPPAMAGPDENTLEQIRQKLKPNRRNAQPEKTIIQPEEIGAAVEYFKENLAEYQLQLAAAEAINYGHRLRIAGPKDIWCELNLFYGKRGFSIVKTTKTGSHAELADLAARVLRELLYDRFEQLN
ncbi:CRISPR-associated primase-polymerase type B [Neolewinella lacunae]|uniref:BT4734-like N-terminal domain-containing protein n=1 Tax=Neolewinella lacunae TaxID=1517758 RepID=A0A923PPU3_9BACT|nr:CRISPR-associated primase-polymerase type B [Neolewinella lacunae]MBC6995254.1 hypothetical protein [Neolewinella lacunae]MDN3635437.1 CRISPR-associated primase-polymerase type B [Neolewinella lacunae]